MEVVGTIASAVQLAEVLTRALISISKLYRSIRDAPEYVRRANNQLNQLTALLTFLQPCIRFPAYTHASNDIYPVLNDCHRQANELAEVLDRLLLEQTKSRWKTGWSAVRSLKTQEKITQIVDHLERHKSTLILWVAVGNQSSLTRVECALERLQPIELDNLLDERQNMESKRIPKSYQVVGYEKKDWCPSRSKSYGVSCNCSAKQITTVWNCWGNSQLRSSSVSHKATCPCTDVLEYRYFVPSSFLQYAIQGSIVSYYMNGRHSFVQNLTCHRIVDETRSPAFRLLSRHFDYTSQNKRQLLPGTVFDIEDTLERLQHCFRAGEASPYDINQYGQTLLNMALQFFWALFLLDGLEYQDFARMVRFLAQSGVPLNEHGLNEGSPIGIISSLEENLMPRDISYGDSKQLLLVKHVLSKGGDYEANDDFIQYRGNNLGCGLFSLLPEFFEAANTGQAAKAVMDKDLPKLERIIKAGVNLNHVNSWGTNAVLNARNFAPALKMLLDAGAEPHQSNKGGWNALSGAVAWHDHECIDLLMKYDTAVVGLEILFGILAVRETEVQQKILDALADRRMRLRKLALCHLIGEKYVRLALNEPRPLDSNAREVVEALETRGVTIPAALKIYSERSHKYNQPPEPVYVLAAMQSTTYHLQPLQIEAHQLLVFFESILSTGFREFDAYNVNGMTPLLLCCGKGQWQAGLWLLHKIENQPPRTLAGTTLNALHCFAQWFGELHGTGSQKPLSRMKNLVRELQEAGVQVDQPVILQSHENAVDAGDLGSPLCYCHPNGQTAIVTLTKELAACLRNARPESQTSFLSSTLLHSIVDIWSAAFSPASGSSVVDDVYTIMMRQDTFNRLGLTHTCLDLRGLALGAVPRKAFDEDEVTEIRIEEEELGVQLEELMSSYLLERGRYRGTREEFHHDWVLGLPDYMAG